MGQNRGDMNNQVLIAGGGIGGLAAALACARSGCVVRVYERAEAFSEIGAGIQLGPNVTRVLHDWGLADALQEVAAFPSRLQVRDAISGAELGVLPLGQTMVQRYGAPYVTIHRADMLGILQTALHGHDLLWLNLQKSVDGFSETPDAVRLRFEDGQVVEGDALIGADGLWSRVRQQLLGDRPPRVTGHLAYRALVPQARLPAALRSQHITVWLGPKLHVVQYPVRRGDLLNVVAIVHGHVHGGLEDWDHGANAADLKLAMGPVDSDLQAVMEAMPDWRLWVLCDRSPMGSDQDMARGRVALLGDAAHPMRPYLAQGAGMAIEDAAELGRLLSHADVELDVATMLRRYALNRWQRDALVQARARRNGEIFHLQGLPAQARNLSMRVLGEKLLDQPWLYRGSSV